jgi:hypothetical protein
MALTIKDGLVPAFGRHETFTVRFGWLKRGFDEAVLDPRLFYAADAHHRLGVGKNMAKSIRFWLSATRLMDEVPDPDDARRTVMGPTWFGLSLLAGEPTVDPDAYDVAIAAHSPAWVGKVGFDPYLEDLNSWWLLHWMMLSPEGRLPIWWCSFHSFNPVAFTLETLLEHALAQVEATSAWSTPSPPKPATVKKDVLALLRAYAGTSGSRRRDKADDTVDAPLVPLQLIQESDSGFRFTVGAKPHLAPEVAAFACLDFLARTGTTSRTVLVPTLASEAGGPGRAFKLTARELSGLLARASAHHPELLELSSTAGADTLVVASDDPLPHVSWQLLYRYYGTNNARVVDADGVPPLATPDLAEVR